MKAAKSKETKLKTKIKTEFN
jgi:hypothetical protein